MADELLILSDGTNQVNFLSGEGATTGYIKRNLEGLDPPPCEIRYAGGRPVNREWQNREINIVFSIVASDASDLTTKKTTIITILENTYLYWVSNGKRGLKAQFQYRRPDGTNISYADVYSGECDWGTVEHQRGAAYAYVLEGAQLHLTCETGFHPNTTTNLKNAITVFNHDDVAHDNFIGITAALIEGDMEAPARIVLVPSVGQWKNLRIARRSRGTPGLFAHVREAEDATTFSDWAATEDAACSGGSKVRNDAIAQTGYVEWVIPDPGVDQLGRFYVLARAATDDNTNTKLKLSYKFSASGDYIANDWKRFPQPSSIEQFEGVPLGSMYYDPKLPSSTAPLNLYIKVEYSKDIDDVVALDCIMLLPEDESACRILAGFNLDAGERFEVNETLAVPYWGVERSYTSYNIDRFMDYLTLQPAPISLKPGVDNYLYFVGQGEDVAGNKWDIDHTLEVTIDYLPQYLVPLE